MATDKPYDSSTSPAESSSQTIVRKRSLRLPILVGVLAGMVCWIFLASLETPSFYRISIWVFDETSPKTLFATPGYYCIHRSILLALCCVGGAVGVAFSSMRKRNAILFLCGVLAIVALFSSLFPR